MLDNPSHLKTLEPYIRIVYRYTDIDWNVKPLGKFNSYELPAKACTVEDFGEHPEGKNVFKAWTGYSMICPDFDKFDITKVDGLDKKTWLMTGSMSSFVIKRAEFVIERCRDTKENRYCKSDDAINTFISDL
jgi:hypothetical protein